jgi:hypothetical protein
VTGLDAAVDFSLVCLFGVFAGAAELLSRYRDAPFRAMRRRFGVIYLLVNAVAGIAGLSAVHALDLRFGVEDGSRLRWTRVLVAGFSSVALFRSSLFTVRAGDRDVPIGPAAALQQLLITLDREVDREQADRRTAFLSVQCADLPADTRTLRSLTALCLAIMQNVSAVEQNQVKEQTESILRNTVISPIYRRDLVCLQLLAVVGFDVLEKAITRVKQETAREPDAGEDEPPPPILGTDADGVSGV